MKVSNDKLSRRNAMRRLWLMGAGTATAAVAIPAATAGAETDLMVSVMEKGATGDGITDDTPAIHAARDTAGEGGKVLFPPGAYLVDGLTASVDKQVWDLRDGATVKMMTGASQILEITGSGVTVNGGVFDGSNGTAHDWSQQGILITSDGVTISGVTVRNSPKLGIYVSNCNNTFINGCSIINSWDTAIFVNNTLAAPSLMHGVRIVENLIDNEDGGPRAAGIGVLGNTVTQRVSDITISQNIVHLPYNQPNQTGGIGAFFCENWVIDDNLITGGWASITSPTATRAKVSNNICRGFWGIGIELPDIVTDCTVVDNIINPDGSNGTDGIVVGSAGQITRLTVTGNIIGGFTGRSNAISLDGGSLNNVLVANNAIYTHAASGNTFNGINCRGDISNSLFASNTIDANSTTGSYGIQFLNGVRGVAITGNLFDNIEQRVINFAAISEAVDGIVIVSNRMNNSAHPPIYLNKSAETASILITDEAVLTASG